MGRLFFLFLAATTLWTTQAAAQEKAEKCTAAKSVAATVEQINDDFDTWRDMCVRLRVIHDHRKLLADRLSLIEVPGEEGGPAKRSLAIYYPNEIRHKAHRPAWETVIGRVGGCQDHYAAIAAERERDPGTIIMLTGLCHYTLDNYVRVVAFHDRDATPVLRLRAAEIAGEDRELRPITASPELRPYIDAAERIFAALEQDDFDAFASLSDPETLDRQKARREFRKASKAYRQWEPQTGQSNALLDVFDARSGEAIGGDGPLVCRCKSGDCGGVWPVVVGDVDGDPARPYFCVETGDYVIFRQGTVPYASVPLRPDGYAEPGS